MKQYKTKHAEVKDAKQKIKLQTFLSSFHRQISFRESSSVHPQACRITLTDWNLLFIRKPHDKNHHACLGPLLPPLPNVYPSVRPLVSLCVSRFLRVHCLWSDYCREIRR